MVLHSQHVSGAKWRSVVPRTREDQDLEGFAEVVVRNRKDRLPLHAASLQQAVCVLRFMSISG